MSVDAKRMKVFDSVCVCAMCLSVKPYTHTNTLIKKSSPLLSHQHGDGKGKLVMAKNIETNT